MGLAATPTTDLSDTHGAALRVCAPVFRDYGGRVAFAGPVITLRTFEDNLTLRALLETEGHGRVLVVDGGGSLGAALFGGNLAKLADANGWAGLVINGAVRDRAEIAACQVGVKALNHTPVKGRKERAGEIDRPVTFAGVTFLPGDLLYADLDGIVLLPPGP